MRTFLRSNEDNRTVHTDVAASARLGRRYPDHRQAAVAQGKLADMVDNSPRVVRQQAQVATQRQAGAHHSGLPDRLKSGIESLSGMSMDHVKVHYNSDKPARMRAHAYAQGSEIHLAAGQEKHLPHEAWHVVQQAQGRVRPTFQMLAGAVNNDPSLESEADTMGANAARFSGSHDARQGALDTLAAAPIHQRAAAVGQHDTRPTLSCGVVQRMTQEDIVTKADQKELKELKSLYNTKLGLNSDLYHDDPETFDQLFENASSLADLKTRIEREIVSVQRRHDFKQSQPVAPVPAPTVVVATPAGPGGQLGGAGPGPGPAPKKAAKQTSKQIDPIALGFNYGPAMVQQAYESPRAATNLLIQSWIGAKPAGSSIEHVDNEISDSTVYINIELRLAQNGLAIPLYKLEIHYHPVPTTSNYLHIKAKAGGTAANKITPTSWLLPAGALDSADADWDAAYPNDKSKKPRH